MKKKLLSLLLVSALTIAMCAGCGGKGNNDVVEPTPEATPDVTADGTDSTDEEPEDTEPVETHEGEMRSELSNEWIPEAPANSRPVAMMIPNDKGALPHYNISTAAVIYQAPVEGSISRLMAIWDNPDMLDDRTGNIRSARTYFVYWAMEWDALFIHHGNPWYADAILDSGLVTDLDCNSLEQGTEESHGTVSRNNDSRDAYWYRSTDRNSPQNAYTSGDSLKLLIENRNIASTYTDRYQGPHFTFADEENPTDLSTAADAIECNTLDMSKAYPIDEAYFEYDEESGKYLRYEFGNPHVDASNDQQLAFENIIVQSVNYYALDEKGYLHFYFKSIDNDECEGYYITDGYAIPITWEKADDFEQTKFYDANGDEIVLNTGKTMVCVIKNNTSVTIS